MFYATDFSVLSTHGFFNDYVRFRTRLVAHARSLYVDLKNKSAIPPSITDCELELELELPASALFSEIVAELSKRAPFPGPQDSYWALFIAGPIARYVTDKEWLDISV
jgi:hypothetical protein